jgi:uncharacterized protein with von Willebrand factor type A (vWA) domain
MKYEISVEEALKMIIEKNLPVNLFLKEGGMSDLVESFRANIRKQIQDILNTYNLNPIPQKIDKELISKLNEILNLAKKHKFSEKELKKALAESRYDFLRRIKWNTQNRELMRAIDSYLENIEDKNKIEEIISKFTFSGKEIPSIPTAKKIALHLEQLKALEQALTEALESGDLFNVNLEKIAQFLGAESYQEFLERRDSIFQKLSQLLEQRGDIIQTEDGELKLSPASIRKIGNQALSEIFSEMKADSSSGMHFSKEFGDSENLTSITRKFEFGDNISNIDFSSSILNSLHRGNGVKPSLIDLEVYEARGCAKSATVILLDMSGSMSRSMRFYNAKKMLLAMNSLIQKDYKDDKLILIGFGTLARVLSIAEVPTLQPYPVTIFNPYIKLKFNLSKMKPEEINLRVPLYFTNLQRGLQLARQVLGSKQIKNKDIILITDGAPTAHIKGSVVHVNYPPTPPDFEEALREVKLCKEDGITINTFLLTNEWDFNYFGEKSFIHQFAKISGGRIFYPHPNELNKLVLFDFIKNKKKKFSF